MKRHIFERKTVCPFVLFLLAISLSIFYLHTSCKWDWTQVMPTLCCLFFFDIRILIAPLARLVIGTSRTVGSAKKFVRITSGFGGGEFTKTLRKVCTCQKLKFSFLLLEYCKIRECYAVANAFTIRNMYSLFLYMKCNSRKINRPTKNMTKIVTLLHF